VDDEDIPTHDDSPVAIQGPITRARARQLQYQVKSFLSSTPCQLQDKLLPNEILLLGMKDKHMRDSRTS
jgi:hypothetical protein